MNLHWIDWGIIAGLLIILFLIISISKRHTNSVSGFLSADRCAARYLLGISEQMANLGAISFIAMFQMYSQAGFTVIFWQNLLGPISVFILLTGFVIYRYRETRVFTLAEFFEKRYSKNFRIFAGFIIFLSGILNFGIFPGIGSSFFIYFCGLPKAFTICGILLPTFPLLMALLLGICLYFTYCGGQIGVMLTDFAQGVFTTSVLLIISVFILVSVKWTRISETLLATPQGSSMINPFHGNFIPDFNLWFFIMGGILGLYQTRAWQGTQGFNCAALSPHEAKMGGVMGSFRGYVLQLTALLLPLATYTFINHPSFSTLSHQIASDLNQMGDEQLKSQMLVPVAMSHFLKTGMIGAFAAVFLGAFISCHIAYLHSWGSIFIQDVVMPFRKKPFTKEQHMRLLRLSILGVAIFIFFFSLIYQPKEAIQLYFQITAAVYLGGAGAVIIGGLYWKKGTTPAAYSAILIGAVLALCGIIVKEIKPDFFLNGMQISFATAIISMCGYAIISLLWPSKVPCDMDKLLNRGKYAVKDDGTMPEIPKKGILAKLGITEEFTAGDKFIYGFAVTLTFLFCFTPLLGIIYNYFIAEIPDRIWADIWKYYLLFILFLSIVITLWMFIGGFINVRQLLHRLKIRKVDESDDGWVRSDTTSINNQNKKDQLVS